MSMPPLARWQYNYQPEQEQCRSQVAVLFSAERLVDGAGKCLSKITVKIS